MTLRTRRLWPRSRSAGGIGVRLGLGRTRALLRELGDPQLGLRGALVAGTNGKGSVLALAGSAVRAAGLRVGETPKPHLMSYRERLQVDGRPVDAATFARLVGEALAAADRVPARLGPPTEFELLTAVVFRWFAEQRLDLALVEVGLGGRLDATHAWDGGVAAITNVDLDHTERLGPTIAHIAREKAAIIERGDRAVTGTTGEALAIVRRRAARMRAPLTVAAPAPIVGVDRDGLIVDLPSTRRDAGGAARAAPGGERRRRRRDPRCPRRRRHRRHPAGGPPERLRRRPLAGPARAVHRRRSRRPPRRRPQPGRRGGPRRRRSTTSARS